MDKSSFSNSLSKYISYSDSIQINYKKVYKKKLISRSAFSFCSYFSKFPLQDYSTALYDYLLPFWFLFYVYCSVVVAILHADRLLLRIFSPVLLQIIDFLVCSFSIPPLCSPRRLHFLDGDIIRFRRCCPKTVQV